MFALCLLSRFQAFVLRIPEAFQISKYQAFRDLQRKPEIQWLKNRERYIYCF